MNFMIKNHKTTSRIPRSGEVVTRSMRSSMLACILTTIAPQLVLILNSLIVSRLLGVECFESISVFNPISGIVILLINTCCLGPSIQAGKAYGELNFKMANGLFTLAGLLTVAIGVISVSIIFFCRSVIVGLITSDSILCGYLLAYIGPICIYMLLSIGTNLLNSFVTASGHVKQVTTAVIASGVINVLSIYILIKFFHFGIASSGFAMGISAATNIIMLIPIILRGKFPFRFIAILSEMKSLLKDNVLMWLSVNSGSLSDGFFQFMINIIILHFLPSDGLFIWGICLIAINIIAYTSTGISNAYLYLDAFLMGEGDSAGRLKIAKRFLLEQCAITGLFAVIFTLFPQQFGVLFGADTPALVQSVKMPLICIAWFTAFGNIFMAFGYFSIQRRPMIKLGYDIVAGLSIPLMSYLMAIVFGGSNLWFGFVATVVILALYVVVVNRIYCKRDRNLIPFFLMNMFNDVVTLDVSVKYSQSNIQDVLSQIRKFLEICEISETLFHKVELCCEEVINNLMAMCVAGKTFDIRLSDCRESVNLVVKNLGQPINPAINNRIVNDFAESGKIPDEGELRMLVIARCSDSVEYQYVYGMNVANFRFNKEQLDFAIPTSG